MSESMKRKERFFAAVKHQQVDRLPMFDFLFQQPMYQELIGDYPEAYNGKDAVRCALALNHDGVWLPFGGYSGFQPEILAENVYKDEWGTTFKKDKAAWPIDAPIDYPIKSRDDLKKYCPPDPTLPGRTSEIEIAREMFNDDIALLGGVVGPFSGIWMLMGYERICFSLYDDPGILTEICKIVVEYSKEAAKRSVEAGCEAIWICDDLGDSKGGFFRLEHFHEYFLPPLIELTDYIDSLDVPVLLHSCGNINEYLDDLTLTKISAIHPMQRTAKMDIAKIKQRYGKRFCLIGNIDSSRTLPYATPEQVATEVRETIDIAAPGGGYILASDHSLHDGIPIENIVKMMEVGLEYGTTNL
jgi:uroporphyrinogen decarboxylase